MKKPYKRPQVVELGNLRELTLGSGGTLPDWSMTNWQITNNNGCNPSFSGQQGCVVR